MKSWNGFVLRFSCHTLNNVAATCYLTFKFIYALVPVGNKLTLTPIVQCCLPANKAQGKKRSWCWMHRPLFNTRHMMVSSRSGPWNKSRGSLTLCQESFPLFKATKGTSSKGHLQGSVVALGKDFKQENDMTLNTVYFHTEILIWIGPLNDCHFKIKHSWTRQLCF